MNKIKLAAYAAAAFGIACVVVGASPWPVSAAPPASGVTTEPLGAVACDTLEQVEQIAAADDPGAEFALLNSTPSLVGNEPACVVATFPAGQTVLATQALGEMAIDGVRYNGWAIQIRGAVSGSVFWLLYAEPVQRSGLTPAGVFA